MIVHANGHYPHFGVCIISHMCPTLIEHMVPKHFGFFHSSLGLQLRNICLKKTGKNECVLDSKERLEVPFTHP